MSEPRQVSEDYYFAALGRERGDYLDVLGLDRTATDGQISKREKEYRAAIDADWRRDYKAQKEAANAAKEKRLVDLGKLKDKYDAVVAARRKLKNIGRVEHEFAWLDQYDWLRDDAAKFWAHLEGPRVLDAMAADTLTQVMGRWITRSGMETGNGAAALPSQKAQAGQPMTWALLADVLAERDLVELLSADALWGEVAAPQRSVWQAQVEAWAKEENPLFEPHLLAGERALAPALAPMPRSEFTMPIRALRNLDAYKVEPIAALEPIALLAPRKYAVREPLYRASALLSRKPFGMFDDDDDYEAMAAPAPPPPPPPPVVEPEPEPPPPRKASALAKPTRRSIDRLEAEELTDFAQEPVRQAPADHEAPADVQAFFDKETREKWKL